MAKGTLRSSSLNDTHGHRFRSLIERTRGDYELGNIELAMEAGHAVIVKKSPASCRYCLPVLSISLVVIVLGLLINSIQVGTITANVKFKPEALSSSEIPVKGAAWPDGQLEAKLNEILSRQLDGFVATGQSTDSKPRTKPPAARTVDNSGTQPKLASNSLVTPMSGATWTPSSIEPAQSTSTSPASLATMASTTSSSSTTAASLSSTQKPLSGHSMVECPANGLLTFEISTGFIYKPVQSDETLAMMPSTLQLTDCLDYCLHNSSCLAINFEMGLCVLLASSARENQQNLYSSQFPVFTIYAEKKCLLASSAPDSSNRFGHQKPRRRCPRAWSFERVAGFQMKVEPRRRLKSLATRELCMDACLLERDFECRSANWFRRTGECTLSDQDRHSVSQSEAGDQRIRTTLLNFYGPSAVAKNEWTQRDNGHANNQHGSSLVNKQTSYNHLMGALYPAGSLLDKWSRLSNQLDRSSASAGRTRKQIADDHWSQLAGQIVHQQPSQASVDYLENNCIFEPNKLCEFRKIQNRVLKTVDSIYQEVNSLEECKQKCLNAPYRCYSFDYGDTSERVCRTSHLDQASLLSVREPYLDVAGAITYELATCFNVTIQCRARDMVATVSSSRVFRGKIYAKSRPTSCVNDVREALKFELSMGYHDEACDVRASTSFGASNQHNSSSTSLISSLLNSRLGAHQHQAQMGIFSNDIVIQHHDRIVTTQDVGLSVYCQYDLGNRSVTTNNVDLAIERIPEVSPDGTPVESKQNQQLQASSNGSVSGPTSALAAASSPPMSITWLATTVVKSPNVTMRITNMNGQPVTSATVGDRLALLFEIKEKSSPFGIFVREIVAMDGKQLLLQQRQNTAANQSNTNTYDYLPAGRPELLDAGADDGQENSVEQRLAQANGSSVVHSGALNSIQFIDSDGCPTDSNLMGPLVKLDPAGHRLLAPFDAFKFPTSDMVFFRALVTSCLAECKPAVCSPSFGAESETARATSGPSQDNYPATSTRQVPMARQTSQMVSSELTSAAADDDLASLSPTTRMATTASSPTTTTTTTTTTSTPTTSSPTMSTTTQPATKQTHTGGGLISADHEAHKEGSTDNGRPSAGGAINGDGDLMTIVAGFSDGPRIRVTTSATIEPGQLTMDSGTTSNADAQQVINMTNNHNGRAPPRPSLVGAANPHPPSQLQVATGPATSAHLGPADYSGGGGRDEPKQVGQQLVASGASEGAINLANLSLEQKQQLVSLFETKIKQQIAEPMANNASLSDLSDLYTGFLASISMHDDELSRLGQHEPPLTMGSGGNNKKKSHATGDNKPLGPPQPLTSPATERSGENATTISQLDPALVRWIVRTIENIVRPQKAGQDGGKFAGVDSIKRSEPLAQLDNELADDLPKLADSQPLHDIDNRAGAYQSFGRRRRRRRDLGEPVAATSAGADTNSQLEPSNIVHMDQPQFGVTPLIPGATGVGHFRRAIVTMYHRDRRQSADHKPTPEHRPKRSYAIEPQPPEPPYDLAEEMVVQSIKIVDRLQFEQQEAKKQQQQRKRFAQEKRTSPMADHSEQTNLISKQYSRTSRGGASNANSLIAAESEARARAENQVGDESDSNELPNGLAEPRGSRISLSAMSVLVVALCFVFVQISMVLICFIDHKTAKRRHQQHLNQTQRPISIITSAPGSIAGPMLAAGSSSTLNSRKESSLGRRGNQVANGYWWWPQFAITNHC